MCVGGQLLLCSFPCPFELDTNCDRTVFERRNEIGCMWQQRQEIRGGEETTQLNSMLHVLQSISLSDSEEKWRLDIGDSKEFSQQVQEDGLIIIFYLRVTCLLHGTILYLERSTSQYSIFFLINFLLGITQTNEELIFHLFYVLFVRWKSRNLIIYFTNTRWQLACGMRCLDGSILTQHVMFRLELCLIQLTISLVS